jgi:hypothetical protein
LLGTLPARKQTPLDNKISMEISTPKTTRRSSRLRVEIPVTVTSLDRKHAFAADCMVLVVSSQGCGFRASQALPIETPVLINNLPAGASASGRVASCLPLGRDGQYFLIGVALYNHGNVWGIANPPQDWNCASATAAAGNAPVTPTKNNKDAWPFNRFSNHGEAHPGRK